MAVFKDHKKDPDATLDWIFDWNDWLAEFETIVSAVFITDPGVTTSEGRTDDRSFTLRCTNR
jgi:hypothetical protein